MYDHVYKYTTPKVCRKYADLHARVGGVSHLPQHPSGASFPSSSSSFFFFSYSLRTCSIASLSLLVIALRLSRLVFSLCSAGPLIVLRLFGTSFFRASLDAFGSFVTSSVLASAAFAFSKKATLPLCLSKAGADFRLCFLGVAIPSSRYSKCLVVVVPRREEEAWTSSPSPSAPGPEDVSPGKILAQAKRTFSSTYDETTHIKAVIVDRVTLLFFSPPPPLLLLVVVVVVRAPGLSRASFLISIILWCCIFVQKKSFARFAYSERFSHRETKNAKRGPPRCALGRVSPSDSW